MRPHPKARRLLWLLALFSGAAGRRPGGGSAPLRRGLGGSGDRHPFGTGGSQAPGAEPAGPFEVLPDGRVVLLTKGGGLFDLAAGRELPAKAPLGIASLAADGSLLIAVRGDRLGWYREGALREVLALPRPGLQVVAGSRQRLYLYGPRGTGSAIHLLEDGRASLAVAFPQGVISALAVAGGRLFFAAGNEIYTVAPGERPALLFLAAGETRILSLAADPVSGVLYFATPETVYAMRAGMAVSILRDLGGTLRSAGGALYVLDAGRACLVRLRGLARLVGLPDAPPGGAAAPGAFKE